MKFEFTGNNLKANLKTAAGRLAKLQGQLVSRSEPLLKQIRHYAEVQGKELQKQLKNSKDVKRVLSVVQKRRKDVESLAKKFPREVKIVRSYLETSVKELERLAGNLTKNATARKLVLKVNLKKKSKKKAVSKKRAKR